MLRKFERRGRERKGALGVFERPSGSGEQDESHSSFAGSVNLYRLHPRAIPSPTRGLRVTNLETSSGDVRAAFDTRVTMDVDIVNVLGRWVCPETRKTLFGTIHCVDTLGNQMIDFALGGLKKIVKIGHKKVISFLTKPKNSLEAQNLKEEVGIVPSWSALNLRHL